MYRLSLGAVCMYRLSLGAVCMYRLSLGAVCVYVVSSYVLYMHSGYCSLIMSYDIIMTSQVLFVLKCRASTVQR